MIGKTLLNNWIVESKIGSGSFGTVYKIRKEEYGVISYAALKVLSVPQSDDDLREIMNEGLDLNSVKSYYEGVVNDIVREISIMSQLKAHPHIVGCDDHQVITKPDKIGWDILIKMELLSTLSSYQSLKGFTTGKLVTMAIELTKALDFCHSQGVIHRDIKPANIFVNELGVFKLGDFGVAHTVENAMSVKSKKGTLLYMAPEVYKGTNYDATVDLYSLGLVLYKCLNNNRLPFIPLTGPIMAGDKEAAQIKRIEGNPIPRPAHGDDELVRIVLKAIAYDRADRYSSAREMLEDLNKYYSANQASMGVLLLAPAEKSIPISRSDDEGGNQIQIISVNSSEKGALQSEPNGAVRSTGIEATVGVNHAVDSEEKLDATVGVSAPADDDEGTVAVSSAGGSIYVSEDFVSDDRIPVVPIPVEKSSKRKKIMITLAATLLSSVILIGGVIALLNSNLGDKSGKETTIEKHEDKEDKDEKVTSIPSPDPTATSTPAPTSTPMPTVDPSKDLVKVPDLQKMGYEESLATLEKAGLYGVESPVSTASGLTKDNWYVITTNPSASTEVNVGSTVLVYYGTYDDSLLGTTPTPTPMPIKVEVTVSGKGGLVTGGGEYNPGDTVTIIASPIATYEFDAWIDQNGNYVSFDNEYSFVVEDGVSYKFTATFKFAPSPTPTPTPLPTPTPTPPTRDDYLYKYTYNTDSYFMKGIDHTGWLLNEHMYEGLVYDVGSDVQYCIKLLSTADTNKSVYYIMRYSSTYDGTRTTLGDGYVTPTLYSTGNYLYFFDFGVKDTSGYYWIYIYDDDTKETGYILAGCHVR